MQPKRLLLSTAAALLLLAPPIGCFADAVDFHPAAPGKDVQSFIVAPEKEPKLAEADFWRLLHQRIKYVFVIYQENRSFDSYFGTFPGADGLFSRPAEATPGFEQELMNTDGSVAKIRPFRIGPEQYAADTDDIDHSHGRIIAKM